MTLQRRSVDGLMRRWQTLDSRGRGTQPASSKRMLKRLLQGAYHNHRGLTPLAEAAGKAACLCGSSRQSSAAVDDC